MFGEQYREASRAPETRRKHNQFFRQFELWCAEHGHEALPATTRTVGTFLAHRADKGNAFSTIKLYRASIGRFHAMHGYKNPTKAPTIREFMDGVDRLSLAPRQVKGLTASDVMDIRAIARNEDDRKWLACIMLMRDGLLRRSEAAALTWDDLDILPDGTAVVHIRFSKTDQAGNGATVHASNATVEALREVFLPGLTGPIFGCHPRTIARNLKRLCRTAGLEGRYGGHSPRIGMVQDLAAAGLGLPEIMQAGRWTSENQVAKYLRNQNAARGAVARYYSRNRRH